VDKATYLEMCEALGTEPDPEELPIEYHELFYECRKAIDCYHLLPSLWSGTGFYIGKDYTGLEAVFSLLNIYQNKQEIMQMLFVIDNQVSKDITIKQKAATKAR
jgi:hypothetical protein